MARRKSRAEVEIETQLGTLDPKSERHVVLSAARDFKVAWVELGNRLTAVRESNSWQNWGYSTFDAYCRRELHIRRDTANKLTRSYSFLRDHEPSALQDRERRELPPLDVVDLLSQAEERAKLSGDQFDMIREEIFAPDNVIPTKGQVLKRFREFDPDAFRSAPRKNAPVEGDIRKALLLAERLQALMEVQDGVSTTALNGVRRAVSELRQIFEAAAQKSA